MHLSVRFRDDAVGVLVSGLNIVQYILIERPNQPPKPHHQIFRLRLQSAPPRFAQVLGPALQVLRSGTIFIPALIWDAGCHLLSS
ncbi:hypothetical protein CYPRO_1944 [Cyclonatronum proteinivorum]|uniref:Uncharacterized protein n=1 Tax=Cyclonatronum proteinivorum TaxID=1457365 RepID=A0A345UL42_9BACT|nr:hypothetical protein CYPRO_1944 [Cyclonatronum proteinivorum]